MILWIIAILLLLTVPVVLMLGNAEEGYENSTGYHKGRQP